MNTKSLFIITFFLIFTSCASRKDYVYFQDVNPGEVESKLNFTPNYKAGDQLSITVSSLNPESAMPFNLPVAAYNNSGTSLSAVPILQSYLVAKDGTIEFPQLGTLKVAGLTRMELIGVLKQKLAPFLVDPNINIQLLNFKVTILGEVTKPDSYAVLNERISVLDAIGMAGDLTIYGTRKNILVIRETEKGKTYNRIDLTKSDFFESPFYYLQQNDVVYVEPNKPKINSSTNSSTNGLIISAVSLLLTIVSITVR